ncbi:unnamed protein product [Schistocephalus solidus]|uniref:DOCKER domain-containing protein n=1 Tax=Schistocephalus solidus TaxID=70667 RepID=A0A183TH67_SCHSO|nr:unnamed protein product [Schistocephalus solidus]
MSGAARGSLTEQYQRNTIITTARSFPYLTTRVEIIAHEDVVLSPVEVALQDVIQRNQQLTRALAVRPPDAKFLQMVLQGCVSATVNQGPLEVAKLFLGKSSTSFSADGEDTLRIKNSLRISLKEFLCKSEEAIDVNRRLVGPDQEEYQHELERSFSEMKRLMSPFLRPNSINAHLCLPEAASANDHIVTCGPKSAASMTTAAPVTTGGLCPTVVKVINYRQLYHPCHNLHDDGGNDTNFPTPNIGEDIPDAC